MTDLQISLIVIGAIIIIGVIVYNKIQEYRAKKRLEQVFSDDSDDILMTRSSLIQSMDAEKNSGIYNHAVDGVSLEDTLEGDDTISITTDQDVIQDQKIEPYLDDIQTELSEESVNEKEVLKGDDVKLSQEYLLQSEQEVIEAIQEQETSKLDTEPKTDQREFKTEPEKELDAEPNQEVQASSYSSLNRRFMLDDIIDQAVLINLREAVKADKILQLSQQLRRIGNKSIHFVGIANEPASDSLWQAIVPGKTYQRLKIGIQIANRTGSITEIEFSDFIMKTSQIATSLGGEIVFPKANAVIQNAKNLYKFVTAHDARLGINVKSQGRPWPIITLIQSLEKERLKKVNNDLFVLQDENNSVLFSLSINVDGASDTARSLTLILDVPCVAQEKDAFGLMVRCAKSLASRLRGIIVDDADRMLSGPMLNDIAQQVDVFYGEMKAASIDAGSARAMRLFN